MTPEPRSQSPDAPPSLDALRPKLTGVQWSARFALVVVGALALAWAWRASGIDLPLLVENRERAVDYLLGQPVSEETAAQARRRAEEQVRLEIQEQARDDVRAEYERRGEQPPGLLALATEAKRLADQRLAETPEAEFEALVAERTEALTPGQRRGGFFPPETDPRAVFGDPDRLPDDSLFARLGDALGGQEDPETGGGLGRFVRWVGAALDGGRAGGYTGELVETVAIAIWGTLLAVLLAVPASLLGAERSLHVLFPGERVHHRAVRWFGRFVVRRSFDIARGFNEVVMAMIFVAVLGLGPFPGVLALFVHTFGVLGKVFSEAIETADPGPIEGVLSTGAGSAQVVSYSVIPQIMPYVISQSLLRFESNVRGATILGVVGAGGIGQLLMDKFGAFEYREVATMMILIIIAVTLIDFLCGRVMKRFV